MCLGTSALIGGAFDHALKKVDGEENAVDMFTKVQNIKKLRLYTTLVGLMRT